MKKIIALALAGAMVFSMPVMAAGSPSAKRHSSENVEVSTTIPVEEVEAAVAAQPYIDGIPAATYAAAAAAGKSVGEYNNNAVASVPGLENAAPIAQGGHVILNGAPSNVTFTLGKPQAAIVAMAKKCVDGMSLENEKLLTVVDVQSTVGGFATAEVDFYMPDVKADSVITVWQIHDDGQGWGSLDVEIRDEHVIVRNLTHLGPLMFTERPASAQ